MVCKIDRERWDMNVRLTESGGTLYVRLTESGGALYVRLTESGGTLYGM